MGLAIASPCPAKNLTFRLDPPPLALALRPSTTPQIVSARTPHRSPASATTTLDVIPTEIADSSDSVRGLRGTPSQHPQNLHSSAALPPMIPARDRTSRAAHHSSACPEWRRLPAARKSQRRCLSSPLPALRLKHFRRSS